MRLLPSLLGEIFTHDRVSELDVADEVMEKGVGYFGRSGTRDVIWMEVHVEEIPSVVNYGPRDLSAAERREDVLVLPYRVAIKRPP